MTMIDGVLGDSVVLILTTLVIGLLLTMQLRVHSTTTSLLLVFQIST